MDLHFTDPNCLETLAKYAEQESARLNGWTRELGTGADPAFAQNAARFEEIAKQFNAIAETYREDKSPLQVALSAVATCGCGVLLLTHIQRETGKCKDCIQAAENFR